jgi:hypothetical protein
MKTEIREEKEFFYFYIPEKPYVPSNKTKKFLINEKH